MLIELHLPRSFDADVTYDPERRVITLSPKLASGTIPLLGVETTSNDGKRKERSLIHFNLNTGKADHPPRAAKRRAASSFDGSDAATE
jgi:hypothetical protein